MDLGIENILVAFFFVLPGFISAAIRRAIQPGHQETVAEWVVTCVIASLTLNAILLALLIPFGGGPLFATSITDVQEKLKTFTLQSTAFYVGGLYLLAISWGIASGLLWRWRPRQLAFLWRLTPIMPDDDVFTPMLEELCVRRDVVVWMRIFRERETILGKIEITSVTIEQDKPIELHLKPAYIIPSGATSPISAVATTNNGGLYLRLGIEDVTELFTTDPTWTPTFPL